MKNAMKKIKDVFRKNILLLLLAIEVLITGFAILWMHTLSESVLAVYSVRDARADYYRRLEYESESSLKTEPYDKYYKYYVDVGE